MITRCDMITRYDNCAIPLKRKLPNEKFEANDKPYLSKMCFQVSRNDKIFLINESQVKSVYWV